MTDAEATPGTRVIWFRPANGYRDREPQKIRAEVFYRTQTRIVLKIKAPYGGMTTRTVDPSQVEPDENYEARR